MVSTHNNFNFQAFNFWNRSGFTVAIVYFQYTSGNHHIVRDAVLDGSMYPITTNSYVGNIYYTRNSDGLVIPIEGQCFYTVTENTVDVEVRL